MEETLVLVDIAEGMWLILVPDMWRSWCVWGLLSRSLIESLDDFTIFLAVVDGTFWPSLFPVWLLVLFKRFVVDSLKSDGLSRDDHGCEHKD